jgi:CRP-like cAMP-binding protein
MSNTFGYLPLPRGGYLIETPLGNVQVGSPPETIKDTMSMASGVPQIFILPHRMFNWIKGISVGEIEFPLYYNFFLKQKQTTVICRPDQYYAMKEILQESLFGPRKLRVRQDYPAKWDREIPKLKNEMNHFRRGLKISNLVQFGLLKDHSFTYKGLRVRYTEDHTFELSYHDEILANVPCDVEYKATYQLGKRLHDPYHPPLYGVTCLGPSHGFDPEDNTSGFIIWLNHRGIMVDPPVNSTEWLVESNVSPKFIDSIILTHCHADHDAGTFQKILEEGRITIYTTRTIMDSFLTKYSAMGDTSVEYLKKLFGFHPVTIGKPLFISGARFDMFYTLHSIPTIGFRLEFQNQTFVYSSDHNNDPAIHKELLEKGIVSSQRYKELSNFPWDSKVIYHESGVPPLHTPIAHLNALPPEIQKRTVVYHISRKDFPQKTSLKLATFGIENTLYFKTEPPEFMESSKILSVFKRVDFFDDLPIQKAQEFIDIVNVEKYQKGDIIVRKGTKGIKFFIIYSGNVSVLIKGQEEKKIYGAYDTFGEIALMTDSPRAANIIAETDVVVFTIEKYRFLNFITNTELEHTLEKLINVRSPETWDLLSSNHFFQLCTAGQKTFLESILIPVDHPGGVIIEEGKKINEMFIIRNGTVAVSQMKKELAIIGKGDFIGTMQKIHRNLPSDYTFTSQEPIQLYAMGKEDIIKFVDKNPGLLMKLVYHFEA